MNALVRYHTTALGARRLHARLAEALARYDAVVAANPEANESGDNSVWHDNFAYEEAQRQMHALGRKVHDLRGVLSRLVVVEPPTAPERVSVGTCVEIAHLDTGEVERWAIAGHEDGDPARGRLSYTSPLGAALMGAEVGELRRIKRGDRLMRVSVETIEPWHEEVV